MNERIKLLAEQATNDVKDEFGHWINSEFNKEKFAELLAQEAADVAYNTYWNNPDKVRGAHLKQAIQQHFGVRS
jgi:hypothetical protein